MPQKASLTKLLITVLPVPVQLKLIPAPPFRLNRKLFSTTLLLALRMIAEPANDTWLDFIVLEAPSDHIPAEKSTTVLPVTVELDPKAIPTPVDTNSPAR
jgi:hypothetical protein